jgi:hypothetical protein
VPPAAGGPISPADYLEKIRLPSAEAGAGLIDEASRSRDYTVSFMDTAVLVTSKLGSPVSGFLKLWPVRLSGEVEECN